MQVLEFPLLVTALAFWNIAAMVHETVTRPTKMTNYRSFRFWIVTSAKRLAYTRRLLHGATLLDGPLQSTSISHLFAIAPLFFAIIQTIRFLTGVLLGNMASKGGAYGSRANDTDFRKKWDKEEYAEKARQRDQEEKERMQDNEERLKQGACLRRPPRF